VTEATRLVPEVSETRSRSAASRHSCVRECVAVAATPLGSTHGFEILACWRLSVAFSTRFPRPCQRCCMTEPSTALVAAQDRLSTSWTCRALVGILSYFPGVMHRWDVPLLWPTKVTPALDALSCSWKMVCWTASGTHSIYPTVEGGAPRSCRVCRICSCPCGRGRNRSVLRRPLVTHRR
jgi:hypothetical protein